MAAIGDDHRVWWIERAWSAPFAACRLGALHLALDSFCLPGQGEISSGVDGAFAAESLGGGCFVRNHRPRGVDVHSPVGSRELCADIRQLADVSLRVNA